MEKVCTPVLPVKVGVEVIPPWKVGVMAPVSVHAAPVFIVTNPANVLAGLVADENINDPDVPPPTVVVPATPKVNAPTVNEVPSPIFKELAIVRLSAVVAAMADPLEEHGSPRDPI